MSLLFDIPGPDARGPALDAAVSALANQDETGRGAVFTRPTVVAAILDLVGYTTNQPLYLRRLLEPSFGGGEFLLAAVDRLLDAWTRAGGRMEQAAVELAATIRAVELHRASFDRTAAALFQRLISAGVPADAAASLGKTWLQCDDFLLCGLPGTFDFVVGNPPYVRQERIPELLVREYRRRFRTLYDRADLYVPFFERALDLLTPCGRLGFICANRWLKNKYGGPLREKIAQDFSISYYIDMEGVDAFHSEVIAYPAITVIQRRLLGETEVSTRVARPGQSGQSLAELVSEMKSGTPDPTRVGETRLRSLGASPWLLDDLDGLELIRRLEAAFPTLEQAGCKVGIGVATGCDRVFIAHLDELPVEPERKLPLVMARDLTRTGIQWSGKGVINPFEPDGRLVDLSYWPRLASYLRQHLGPIAGRHVAMKNPGSWYRTIDRICPALTTTPKLLVPDIKGEARFVLDPGDYYPHHNLYYITSGNWDLRALQTVLRSSVTVFLVANYCTRMSGGFLRFQAQYLRRIRLPHWPDVPEQLKHALAAAATAQDQGALDAPVFELYRLSEREASRVRAMADGAQVTARNRQRSL